MSGSVLETLIDCSAYGKAWSYNLRISQSHGQNCQIEHFSRLVTYVVRAEKSSADPLPGAFQICVVVRGDAELSGRPVFPFLVTQLACYGSNFIPVAGHGGVV